MAYQVEYTDTFGGQANYSWVRRERVEMPAHDYFASEPSYVRELMRRAKAAVGLTGIRGQRRDYGDLIEFRPARSCTVLFINWIDE